MSKLFSLNDRTVMITGAGQGIGRSVGLACAAHGARVLVSDLNQTAVEQVAGEIRAAGGEAHALCLNVVDPEAVGVAVATWERAGLEIDVLVNSAGVNAPLTPALNVQPAEWDRVFAVNTRGLFFACQAVARQMARRGGGSIINIASQVGLVGSVGRAAYTASKGAVVNLTRSLALEWAPLGIRVNAVAPGPVETPLTDYLRESPESDATVISRIPMGRWGQPGEIAGAVLFLASDAASFVTGHVLVADGGFVAQ